MIKDETTQHANVITHNDTTPQKTNKTNMKQNNRCITNNQHTTAPKRHIHDSASTATNNTQRSNTPQQHTTHDEKEEANTTNN